MDCGYLLALDRGLKNDEDKGFDAFSGLVGLRACVDIGGTKVAVSVADAQGIRGRVTEPTAKEGNNDALGYQIIRLIGESCVSVGLSAADVSAVGVSSCGPFVIHDGCIELTAPNICGGMAGKPLDHCAYVTWSTGIGMGLCVEGRVLHGKNGNAGHAGHMFVSDNDDALCGCGNVGDVEGLIAGNAIPRRFGSAGYADAATLFIAAYAGDTRANAIIDDLCRVMGRTLYNLVVTLDLQRISMGGSVFWHHRDFLLPKLRLHVKGKLGALTDSFELVPAGLGDRVGDYAALALVLS